MPATLKADLLLRILILTA